MSTAANLPWGRNAVQSTVYLAIPSYEKVLVKYTLDWIFFFDFRSLKPYIDDPWFNMLSYTIYDTGLGDSLWDSKDSRQIPTHMVEGFPSRRVGSPPETTPPVLEISQGWSTYDTNISCTEFYILNSEVKAQV